MKIVLDFSCVVAENLTYRQALDVQKKASEIMPELLFSISSSPQETTWKLQARSKALVKAFNENPARFIIEI